MLTADLVLVRIYKGDVRPRYIEADKEEHLALAAQLIDTFAQHEGQTRYLLNQELKELLGTGTDFLLHRALAKLLFDRSEFDTEAPMPPEELRQVVFEQAAEVYLAKDPENPNQDPEPEGETPSSDRRPFFFSREAVLAQAAEKLDLKVEDVENSLYADLKDEQRMCDWQPCQPRWLLDRYNVALAQGVLLRATTLELNVTEPSIRRQRELFRKIKFFQLLHRIKPTGENSYTITLDGPTSLFKSSGRYGVQMANFLPTLLHFGHWEISAKLLWGKRRRKCTFKLSSDRGLRPYTKLTGQWLPEELTWLPEQLAKLTSEWTISTDAELVPLGGQGVLVPDFVFQHEASGQRVVMEVFGFWRRGAVQSRLKLLRRHGPKNLILALSKQLATEQDALEDLPGEVYVFRTSPLARQVLALLEKIRTAA